ncbi:MAG: autotransporter outer membrane beta-barrel domain-containing protein, partial [Opitutaceae bacterium]|nr:autotransporter outer membrane beta-barrel domain-containing protein [Opitutaceae bacterium]
YSQNARSTLTVEIDTNRIPDSLFPDLPSPFINIAGPATLSGTLIITGTGFNDIGYTGDGGGRASELSGAPILRAIGGISGDFNRVEIASAGATDLSNLPDFIRGGGLKVNEGGPVPTRYDIGYGLAWNSGVDDAHGTFTVEAGKTFDVDVQLSDRPGIAFASGWDGQSLLKRGPGTLILSIGNAYTGATTVEAGTLQFAGPAEITIGDLVNNSVIDIRGASLATTATTGPAFRTLRATSLAGTGTFRMAVDIAAGTSDHLIIDGDAIGSHRFLITGGGAMPVGDEPMPVLLSIGGVNDTTIDNEITINNAHHIDGAFDYGIFNYQVEVRGNQIVIVNTGLDPAVFAPISGVPGAQSALWFDQQDNLSRRLGELRAPRETGSGFDLWTRAHAASATIGGGSTKMRLSDVDFWGAELGADYTWMLDGDRVTLGLFAGIGNASQDFRSAAAGTATGESDLLGAGLYAAWLDDTGWFANATLAAARYENSFAATDGSLNRVTGDYDENGIGVTIEAGRRIPLNFLGDGWFVEPALQGARARLTRGDYFTRRENGEKYFSVHGSAANITRLRATLRAGRAWAIGAAGWLEIAARASALHERSSGGEITIASAAENRWRPNLDGDRGEAGLGLYWRPFATGQFYFDYEYAAGNNYEKPWSLSLGFRLSL